jgi:hypothetical protein
VSAAVVRRQAHGALVTLVTLVMLFQPFYMNCH